MWYPVSLADLALNDMPRVLSTHRPAVDYLSRRWKVGHIIRHPGSLRSDKAARRLPQSVVLTQSGSLRHKLTPRDIAARPATSKRFDVRGSVGVKNESLRLHHVANDVRIFDAMHD